MRKRYFFIPLIVIIIITGVLVWACKHPYGSGIEGITREVEVPIYLSQEQQNSEYDFESDALFSGTGNIPALTITANKVILAAAGTSAGPVSIKRSLDMGANWSDNVRTLDSGYSYPFFINCHNGDILLGITTASVSDNSETIFYRSRDDGATWNKENGSTINVKSHITNKAKDGYATYGQGIALRHGGNQSAQKLMFPYYYNTPKTNNASQNDHYVGIMCLESGNTFSSVCNAFTNGKNVVSGNIGSFGSHMSTKIIELVNGDILLNMRTQSLNGYTFWMLSKDCGKTWDITVNNQSDENKTGTKKNEGVWGQHADFIRYEFNGKDIKPNGGSQWALMVTSYEKSKNGYSVMLTTNDFNHGKPDGGTNKKYAYTKDIQAVTMGGYPAITVLPDGTIGALLELDNEGIYFKRFNLYWLTSGKEKVNYGSDASLMFQ